MNVTVEIPYNLRDFHVKHWPKGQSGYAQVDMVTLVWQEQARAASAAVEILGTRDDLRALAARIIELIDRTPPDPPE